jgi:hypothetical protein
VPFILGIIQRYTLDDHVSSNAPTLDDPHWRRLDSVVLSWLLGTITVNLQETTHVRDRPTTAPLMSFGLPSRSNSSATVSRAPSTSTHSFSSSCRAI